MSARTATALLGGMILLGAGCRPRPASPPAAAPVTAATENLPDFRDVAVDSGLRFTWKRPRSKIWTNRESFGSGAAVVDYDGDGWMDVFLVGQPRCALFRNRGDGTFLDLSRKAGVARAGEWSGVAAGDYDNDGRTDLFVSGFGGAMLLHNQGNGTFAERSASAGLREREWGTSCAFLDYDTDGDLDLLVGHYVVTGKPYPEYCDGRRGEKTGCPPSVYPPQFPRLYRNEGRGRFSDATLASGLGMAHGKSLAFQTADYDDDGKTDLYLANDGEPGDLFHNLGGRFENVAMQTGTAFGMSGEAQAGMGVDFADYDRDGRLDLVVTAFRNETYGLYRNLGSTFEMATAKVGLDSTRTFLGFGTRFVDYDDDTWPDLVFVNGHVYNNAEANDRGALFRQPTLLYRNERGTFRRVTAGGPGLDLPLVGRGLAVGDFRNDGSQDLLITDMDGGPRLLHNVRRTGNHWLGVQLTGTRCNRSGYGARVTVKWPGGESFRDATASGSYLSSADPRLHFGLGSYAGPVEVRVRWPGGGSSSYPDIPVDRYVRITEGVGRPLLLPQAAPGTPPQ